MIFGSPSDVDVSREGKKLKRALKLWPVGVSIIKSELYGWLKLDGAGDDGIYPAGFCHFPQYDEEHFKRLCSEQLTTKKVNGREVYRWIKTYERNEQLDCRVYARAAASMFGMDRFSDKDWDVLEGKYDIPSSKPINKNVEPRPESKNTTNESKSEYWSRQNQKKFW